MEIQIKEAKNVFKEYIKEYNSEDKQIKLKIRHIERVTDIAKNTAKSLNLGEEDIKLAQLIALLHDIGRFEQVKQYHTFSDKKSVNHGQLGVEILFKEGLIRKFIENDKYDEIIKKAILNHNKAKIEDGLKEKELLHAKIIRDSDKIDIFYSLMTEPDEAIYGKKDISKDIISEKIYKQFLKDKIINYNDMINAADNVVAHFGFVYDFYFDYAKKTLKDKKYLDKYYERIHFQDKNTQEKIEQIYKLAKQYIET